MPSLRLSSLSGRFLAMVALLLVALSVTMAGLAAGREAAALFGELERTARSTGKLLEPSTVNWVIRGDVSDLNQSLKAVLAQDGVVDAYVLDPDGRVLANGTSSGPGQIELGPVRRAAALRASEAGVVRQGYILDAINPLATSGERLGTLVIGYDLRLAEETIATSRERNLLTGLAFAVLGLAVTWLLVRGVTRRLLLLTQAAELAASEQLPRLVRGLHAGEDPAGLAPPPLDEGSFDEVKALAGALNSYRSVVVDMATDLTALARSSDARLRRAFDGSPIGMALSTATGHLLEVNDAMCAMLGRQRADLLGLTFDSLAHPDDPAPLVGVVVRRGARVGQAHRRYLRPDGSIVWTLHTDTLEPEPDGGAVQIFSQVVDTTEAKRAEADMAHLAHHDALTGLPNRVLLADRIHQALARRSRQGKPVALLVIDLDGFKAVNDSLGHGVGDEVLRRSAERLRLCLRAEDTVSRLGGDEFAVLVEADTPAQVFAVSDRILRSMRPAFTLAGRELFLSASIGVAFVCADQETTAANLLRDADLAMYQAKRNGKDDLCVYDRTMHDDAEDRLRMDGELRGALGRGELSLHYQPICGIDGESMVSVEALMRWNHPTRGYISPAEFIPVAEASGLIVTLGAWALDEACRQLRDWQDTAAGGADRLQLSVNLSARQLGDDNLPAAVARTLATYDIEPSRLILEITESMMVDDVIGTIRRLKQLKALGVQLAIDDFGTGYSSLGYLQQFPIDHIKIDKSFVDQLGTPEGRALAEGIINLARALDLKPIAEGIEDEHQRSTLERLGCQLGQGYLFARPEFPAGIAARIDKESVGIRAASLA